jgi:biopolymer transport protein ExbB
MEMVMNFLAEYHVADIFIVATGFFSIALVVDRFKALYLDLHIDAETFMSQVMNLLKEDKVEEAITFCAANEKKPLAHVVKRILERSDRDHEAMEKSMDIASFEIAPALVKNLNHLPMVANVVTLIGLFGTVVGLIIAFKAISFADPAQKQTLLAQGISTAMTATALGLVVAIPTMFIYSFLYTKQSALFGEVDRHAMRVIELLNDRGYRGFDGAFPAIPTEVHAAKESSHRTKTAG